MLTHHNRCNLKSSPKLDNLLGLSGTGWVVDFYMLETAMLKLISVWRACWVDIFLDFWVSPIVEWEEKQEVVRWEEKRQKDKELLLT